MAVTNDTLTVKTKIEVAKETQAQISTWEKYIAQIKRNNQNLRKELIELGKQGKANTAEYKQLNAAIKANDETISGHTKKIRETEKTMGLEMLTMAQLRTRLKDLNREFGSVNKTIEPERWKVLQKEVRETEDRVRKLNGRFEEYQKINTKNMTLASLWSVVIQKVFSFFTDSIKAGIDKIIDFEYANANLAAVLGKTTDGIKVLTDDAKRLGETTEYTASQVTQLQTELAKLGFNENQILDMTEYVLQFATATGADLPQAASLAGAALRMFGLESSETQRVVSAMAVGTNKTALSFEYLNTAMSTVGPVANAFGFTIEDTVALLGKLSDSGFDASSAATATRNILLNLADSGGKLATALGRPITSLDELAPAMQELRDKGVSLNETLELTDKRSVAAFNAFLQSSDSLVELKDSITDVGNELAQMQQTKLNTVQGSMQLLSSAWEGLMLSFYDSKSTFKSVIDSITSIVGWITKNISVIGTIIKVIFKATTAIGTYIIVRKTQIALEERGISNIKALIIAGKSWIVSIGSQIKAIFAKSVADRVAEASNESLKRSLLTSPWGAIALAIGVVVGWLVRFVSSSKEAAAAEQIRNNIAKRTVELENQKSEAILTEKSRLNALVGTIVETNDNEKLRESLIKRLKEEYPDFLRNLGDEKVTNDLLLSVLKDVNFEYDEKIKLIKTQARLTAYQEAYNKAIARQVEIEQELTTTGRTATDDNKKLHNEYAELTEDAEYYLRNIEKITKEEEKQKMEMAKKQTSDYWKNELDNFQKQLESLTSEYSPLDIKIADGDAAQSEIDKANELLSEILDFKEKIKNANEKYTSLKKQESKTTTAGTTSESLSKEEKNLFEKQKKEREKLLADSKAKIDIETAAYNQRLKDAEIYGVKLENMTDSQRKKQLELETEYQNNLQKIALDAENERFEKSKKEAGVSGDGKNFSVEQNKVLEFLTKQHEANMQKIKEDGGKKLVEIQQNIDKAVLKSAKDANTAVLDAVSAKQQAELLAASETAKTTAEYERQKKEIEKQALAERLVAQENYVNSLKILNPTEEQIKEFKAAQSKLKELQIQVNERDLQDKNEKVEKEKQFQEKIKQVREQYGLVTYIEQFAAEMQMLQEQYEQKLLTEEQYQAAKLQIQLKYAQQYAQQSEQFVSAAANAVSAIEEAQTAKISTEYEQRQSALTEQLNQGIITEEEYNAKKEQLDFEQKSKELEVEKKFADANFAMQTAQIVAATAQGIITAWATSMQLGPIAGPIAAAVLTALLGITAAAQIAKAKAERDRVKAMTLQNPGSSQSKGTAQVVLKEGYAEGGYTGAGGKYTVRGTAADGQPIHAGEYVIPQEELRNPALVPMIRAIEGVRLQRSRQNPLPSGYGGYADGGFTNGNTQTIQQQNDINAFMLNELRRIFSRPIKADVNYFEFQQASDDLDTINNFTKKR